MRRVILERLAGTAPAADPDADARAVLGAQIAQALFPQPLLPAAVLVPLIVRDSGISVLLTRRTDHLRDHPGQISFPGGRVDAQDEGPLATALRETREEIGISADLVHVAGYLPAQPVISGFAITPVVGFLPGQVELRPDPVEVAEIFEIPLGFLLDSRHAIRATRRISTGLDLVTVEFQHGGRRIWGATANILYSFINILR